MRTLFLFMSLITTILNSDEDLLFKNTTMDYGKIELNSNGKIEFEYSNDSKKSLFITEAKPSCGCIVVKYNEKEIKKGENGKIEVFYDTQRLGKFVKIITIKTSNSDKVIVLTIKGEVVNI